MPWIKRSTPSYRFYWILGAGALVIVGVSAGYSWWGESASLVGIVEQELRNSQAQVRLLEKRVKALETKMGIDNDTAASEQTVQAY
jgi:uncharacterized membrane protein